ncbi:MAG: sigma-54-dependent Fis family transcriptional regulator [Desulfobacteraceae bacterium]|nr:sigma-54-dependent Fis family transcriptional regulator [Desulfobacteraceae bacterium]
MSRFRVLIADDEKKFRRILQIILNGDGHETDTAQDGGEAWTLFQQHDYDLVITDLKMGDTNGMDLLHKIRKARPDFPVVVITAYGSIESAVKAMKAGAYDYISKPFENEEIKLVVRKAIDFHNLKNENRELREALSAKHEPGEFIGKSPQIEKVRRQALEVAKTPSTVLIQGESGTGKELIARTIHFNSPRASRSFIAVNCAALTENLLESELFGYEKGAFTGAMKTKPGKFELAHTGTLFLDEVGEMSSKVQVKILRALENMSFERLGGTAPIRIDTRILAATNRDLKQLVKEKTFRLDLFYRLNVYPITTPPLREYKDDLPRLVQYYLERLSRETGKIRRALSEGGMAKLHAHSWPGNVRELKNCLERSIIVSDGPLIRSRDIRIDNDMAPQAIDLLDIPIPPEGISLEEVEKALIRKALHQSGHNQSRAADVLKISRSTLRYRMEKHGFH